MLENEVNAAIEGAADAGADRVPLNDSHGMMQNLDPRGSHGARLATSRAGTSRAT